MQPEDSLEAPGEREKLGKARCSGCYAFAIERFFRCERSMIVAAMNHQLGNSLDYPATDISQRKGGVGVITFRIAFTFFVLRPIEPSATV